jgi:Zn-dependent peptidase ImmA (M78 family)
MARTPRQPELGIWTIDPALITLFREMAGLTKAALARLCSCDERTVRDWENGVYPPTNLLDVLGHVLDVHPSALEYDASFAAPINVARFRTNAKLTNPQQREAIAFSRVASRAVTGIQLARGTFDPPAGMGHISSLIEATESMTPKEAARAARKHLNIGAGPVEENIITLVERAGIPVAFAPGKLENLDAISVDVEGTPLIILNPFKGDADRQRFDVAHELGHVLLHRGRGGEPELEDEADEFAAEFLLPALEIYPLLETAISHRTTNISRMWKQLAAISREWMVSLDALIVNAKNLGLLEDKPLTNRYKELAKKRDALGSKRLMKYPRMLQDALQEILASYGGSYETVARNLRVPVGAIRVLASRQPILQPATPRRSRRKGTTGRLSAPPTRD